MNERQKTVQKMESPTIQTSMYKYIIAFMIPLANKVATNLCVPAERARIQSRSVSSS